MAIPSVYLIIARHGQILLSRRMNTGYEDGSYGLVSGHVEAGESLRQAIVREAKEEIGLELNPEAVELALTMSRYAPASSPPERLDFFMRIDQWSGEPVNAEPHKCSDLSWFDLNNLPDSTIPYIRHTLALVSQGTHYCELGWHRAALAK
jgi:ADP-ribose pyrophosphatase YjhB (NUDIX family)